MIRLIDIDFSSEWILALRNICLLFPYALGFVQIYQGDILFLWSFACGVLGILGVEWITTQGERRLKAMRDKG